MRTDLFDFELPEERIALHPVSPRDAARMLVVPVGGAAFADCGVRDLPRLLRAGDALVFNDTRVIPAALEGVRRRGDLAASVAVTLIERLGDNRWRALARPAKRLQDGDRLHFGHDGTMCLAGALDATVAGRGDAGEVDIAFDLSGPDLDAAIAAVGQMPLPPYIAGKRGVEDVDRSDYQTMYAAHDGAVAAPTAGLHFTPELMAALDARGIERHFVTLHVGPGTFLPVKADDTADHKMHFESGEISAATAAALNAVRARGGRIVAVGTTSLRLLETAARDGEIRAFSGATDIFITPGYEFRAVDILMTNFHLPRSTLFMLVAAFAGLERMRAAYAHAIAAGYRFYSYGDASLLFPSTAARPVPSPHGGEG
jgi:S-adenosylmethionine:tRNA ribosyltransferase-isomerase